MIFLEIAAIQVIALLASYLAYITCKYFLCESAIKLRESERLLRSIIAPRLCDATADNRSDTGKGD